MSLVNPQRYNTLYNAAMARRFDLSVLLENVQDPHNISAILRTCDAVGIADVYVLQTRVHNPRRLGFHSSRSATKWMRVHYYANMDECMGILKQRYGRIAVASIGKSSGSLFEAELHAPLCLVFGNEQNGCSEAMVAAADVCFNIPQVGLLQSLNISVACGVVLYELFRQRANMPGSNTTMLSPEQQLLLDQWTSPLHSKNFKDAL